MKETALKWVVFSFMYQNTSNQNAGHWVYTPYVIRNGVKYYPKNAKYFRFWVAD